MRYTRVAHASWMIAIALVAAAVIFASWRSRDVPALAGPAQKTSKVWEGMTAGEEIFVAECATCHPSGELLRGHAAELYRSRGGREDLIRFMLCGEIRSVTHGEESFAPGHPSYEHLSDQSIADALNYMLRAWGNDALLGEEMFLYEASEIASHR